MGKINASSLPSVDRPLESSYAVLSWYPLYGKLNFFDSSIAQFDIYTLIGGGQVKLDSGSSNSMIYGGGIGVWISQHFSTRLEVNYQTYQDQLQLEPRNQDMLTVMLSLGILI
ncbi:MAG: outer membrane beta-barrel domain-containing protein [Bdellovibrionales bacterium]